MAFIDGNYGENFMTEGLIELWDLLDDESRKEDKMGNEWLLVIAIIIIAFGVQHNRNDIDELKRQIDKLKGGDQ